MIALTKRPWSLSIAQRLLIALIAGAYLVAFRPWAQPNPSVSATVYAGAVAMLVLAVLPSRFRLITALAIAVVVAFVVLVVGRAALGS